MTFTDQEKAEVAAREVKWRKRVYPNRIVTGRMTEREAKRQIAVMEEIAADYKARLELPL